MSSSFFQQDKNKPLYAHFKDIYEDIYVLRARTYVVVLS